MYKLHNLKVTPDSPNSFSFIISDNKTDLSICTKTLEEIKDFTKYLNERVSYMETMNEYCKEYESKLSNTRKLYKHIVQESNSYYFIDLDYIFMDLDYFVLGLKSSDLDMYYNYGNKIFSVLESEILNKDVTFDRESWCIMSSDKKHLQKILKLITNKYYTPKIESYKNIWKS